jgi:hypothetical protein
MDNFELTLRLIGADDQITPSSDNPEGTGLGWVAAGPLKRDRTGRLLPD